MYKDIYRKIKEILTLSKRDDKIYFSNRKSISRGLTLVELLVVISIFLVITSTVIFNYGGFRSNISLQNLTDDIALSIRKAQSFAIGARGVNSNFSNSYGVHFSNIGTSSETDSSIKSFLMFSTDASNKGYIDNGGTCGPASSNCMESFKINTADVIESITLSDGSNDISFADGAYLDIIFTRPNPRANFCYRTTDVSSGCDVFSNPISNVKITISNGQVGVEKKTRSISVQNTGQISIE